MSRSIRSLTRLIVGMCALVLTGMGGAAFASVPPPDPAVAPSLQTLSVPVIPVASGSGMSMWAVVLIAALAISLGVALTEALHGIRRQRPASGPATV
jgi:hypothetical protein